jgi:hypothetical protein
MKKTAIAVFAALTFTCAGISAAEAHHAISAQFDPQQTLDAEGTLVKFELINPHSYAHIMMNGPDGVQSVWSFETGASSALRRAGISTKDAFKAGEKVKFSYHPARNGSHTGLLIRLALPDGRMIGMGTLRSLGQGPQ